MIAKVKSNNSFDDVFGIQIIMNFSDKDTTNVKVMIKVQFIISIRYFDCRKRLR